MFKAHVTQVLVCDPRKNALLKVANKSDRIDSRKLAELLRANLLRSVYHEDTRIRTVKELARGYMTITRSHACDGSSESAVHFFYLLYLHTLASSLSSPKKSTPLFSGNSKLFLQNTRGGEYPPINPIQRTKP